MKWKLQNEPKFFGFPRVILAKARIQTSVNIAIIYFINLCAICEICGSGCFYETNPNVDNFACFMNAERWTLNFVRAGLAGKGVINESEE